MLFGFFQSLLLILQTRIMDVTNIQLRAELFREINPLLDNEAAIKKMLVFLKTCKSQDSDDKEQVKIKLEDLEIPAKLRRKRGCIQLTEEDMKDERIQYIVNK